MCDATKLNGQSVARYKKIVPLISLSKILSLILPPKCCQMKNFLLNRTGKQISFILFAFCIICFAKTIAQPTLGFNKILSGLSSPVDIRNAGDSSQRIFIVEQQGDVRVYKNGKLLKKPFLNISNLVKYNGEQGLLSIAFHPNYKNNRAFYIYYNNVNGDITLARYFTSRTNLDSADASSGVILFSKPKPGDFGNHNGGTLQFGKDGYLYLSIGDGGGAGDPFNNAQNGQSFFGKMLRLKVLVYTAPYYTIPPDNPFVNDPNVLDEIYFLGLRNPWKWSFDRQTANMWIGDVGQDSIEEIDFRRPLGGGANFGWRCYEGTHPYNSNGCKQKSAYVFPLFQYHHDVSTGGATVIGGYVYRGTKFPGLHGYYICADYISANAWKIKSNGTGGWNVYLQKGVPAGIVSFGENEAGELYASTRSGDIYHVVVINNFVETTPEVTKINTTTFIYPTLVDNRTITLVLNDVFYTIRLLDMSGHEVMRKDIAGVTGKITLHLSGIKAGMYIAELVGKNTVQQKIYITK